MVKCTFTFENRLELQLRRVPKSLCQLLLEDKYHHSVGEVPKKSDLEALEKVSVAELCGFSEGGERTQLLAGPLVHGDGLEGVHRLSDQGSHASRPKTGAQVGVHPIAPEMDRPAVPILFLVHPFAPFLNFRIT